MSRNIEFQFSSASPLRLCGVRPWMALFTGVAAHFVRCNTPSVCCQLSVLLFEYCKSARGRTVRGECGPISFITRTLKYRLPKGNNKFSKRRSGFSLKERSKAPVQ